MHKKEGLKLVSENIAPFLENLKEKGYIKLSQDGYKKILLWFVEYLTTNNIKSRDDILNKEIIEKFIKWKIESRQKKDYAKDYRTTIKRTINKFFDWYFTYDRLSLEKAMERYFETITYERPRWRIELHNELLSFFDYLENNDIENLRRVAEPLLSDYVLQKENGFYKKRDQYSSSYDNHNLKSIIKNFYRYLNKKGLSEIEFPLKDPKQEEPLHFYEAIYEYLEFCKDSKGLSLSGLYNIKYKLKKFDWFLQTKKIKKLSSIKLKHVDEFNDKTCHGKLKAIHASNSVLREFFRYLYYYTNDFKKDYSQYLIAAPIYRMDEIPKYLKDEDIKRVFESVNQSTPEGKRLYAVIMIMYFNGLRHNEVARLTLDDINWEEKRLVVSKRKNFKPLVTPLSDGVVRALRDYVLKARPNDRPERSVFFTMAAPIKPITVSAIVTMLSKYFKHGLKIDGGGYRLRHTFAQNLLESGSSLHEVKELLGQRRIQSTQKYTKSSMTRMRKYVVHHDF